MKPTSPFLLLFQVSPLLINHCLGGFQPPPSRAQLYKQLFGEPCDCKEIINVPPKFTSQITAKGPIDCGDKTAYLTAKGHFAGGWQQRNWKCVKKVRPSLDGSPCKCFERTSLVVYDQMHSSCYTDSHLCKYNRKTYYQAILLKRMLGKIDDTNSLV